jgi:ATP-dependent DNA ligase
MTGLYADYGKVQAIAPAPLQPRDPRFVHGPTELCQLAGVWTGKPLTGGPWIVEEKVDGIRCLWIDGAILTRKGEPMACAEHLRPEFERLQRRFGRPMFFDGEYYEEGGFLPTLKAYRRGEGSGRFYWFDAFPADQWSNGDCPADLEIRRQLMERALGDWSPRNIVPAPQRSIVENEDLERLAQWFWDKGSEGMMLKDGSAPYVRGRRPSWLKVKRSLKLEATYLERLKEGAAARIEYQGRKLRVAVPPPLRGNHYAAGDVVSVEAMEWTDTGQLRQGRLTEGKERT